MQQKSNYLLTYLAQAKNLRIDLQNLNFFATHSSTRSNNTKTQNGLAILCF
jgi:hypothetical protein